MPLPRGVDSPTLEDIVIVVEVAVWFLRAWLVFLPVYVCSLVMGTVWSEYCALYSGFVEDQYLVPGEMSGVVDIEARQNTMTANSWGWSRGDKIARWRCPTLSRTRQHQIHVCLYG